MSEYRVLRTERQHPQTPEDIADEILRYLTRYRRVFEQRPGAVRSLQFTVKFKDSVATPRQAFWSIETDTTRMLKS